MAETCVILIERTVITSYSIMPGGHVSPDLPPVDLLWLLVGYNVMTPLSILWNAGVLLGIIR